MLKSPSFGTQFSICCPYVYLAHYNLLKAREGQMKLAQAKLSPNLLRLSVGMEDPDLITETLKVLKGNLTGKANRPCPLFEFVRIENLANSFFGKTHVRGHSILIGNPNFTLNKGWQYLMNLNMLTPSSEIHSAGISFTRWQFPKDRPNRSHTDNSHPLNERVLPFCRFPHQRLLSPRLVQP